MRGVYLLTEISSMPRKNCSITKEGNGEATGQAKWSLLAQKRKFFLSPRKRNDAPTVSNTPPTGSNPIGARDSIRNATTPILENIALRQI